MSVIESFLVIPRARADLRRSCSSVFVVSSASFRLSCSRRRFLKRDKVKFRIYSDLRSKIEKNNWINQKMAGLVTQFARCSVRTIVGTQKTEIRRIVSSKSLPSLVRHISSTQALRKVGKLNFFIFLRFSYFKNCKNFVLERNFNSALLVLSFICSNFVFFNSFLKMI